MAEIILRQLEKGTKSLVIAWEGIGENDTCQAFIGGVPYSDKTVHVYGDFDSGTVAMEGSNDPTALTDPDNASWFPLTYNATAISGTSDYGSVIVENPLYIRPNPTSLGSSSSVNVVLTGKCR